MPETKNNADEICNRFDAIHWHDSEIQQISIKKDAAKNTYDIVFDLRLITQFSDSERKYIYEGRHLIFKHCRITLLDLDLLGMLLCRGAIADAVCYKDAMELEKKIRDKAKNFDLPERNNPLEYCLGFRIYMLPPSGNIFIFARDFELQPLIETV